MPGMKQKLILINVLQKRRINTNDLMTVGVCITKMFNVRDKDLHVKSRCKQLKTHENELAYLQS